MKTKIKAIRGRVGEDATGGGGGGGGDGSEEGPEGGRGPEAGGGYGGAAEGSGERPPRSQHPEVDRRRSRGPRSAPRHISLLGQSNNTVTAMVG